MSARSDIRASIAASSDEVLADKLLNEFDELSERYYLGDFRPSELGGARFSEAAFRICQCVCFGSYTDLSKSLPGVDKLLTDLGNVPTATADDGFRIHIPRTLRVIYDLRNKRDVAHLGAGVIPNWPDASLILACASWVVAEIVRLSHQCTIDVAQELVDSLMERTSPLIWAEGDVMRVLDPSLRYRDQVLLILHHVQPERVGDSKLAEWVEYSNRSAFKTNVLRTLHKEALIDYREGEARILPPGTQYVEKELKRASWANATT